jgi:hypothetical protein
MVGWIEALALEFEGLDKNDIAALDMTQDDLIHLLATLQVVWPRINRAAPVIMRLAQKVIEKQKALTPHS